MNDTTVGLGEATTAARRRRSGRLAKPAGLLAAGAVAGGILAASFSAAAVSTSPSSTATQGSSGYPAGAPAPQGRCGPVGGSAPVRSDERALGTADAAKVKAAALAAVKGGTVYRVETDAGDAAYEAHLTKADGTLATVKLDKSFKVIRVESGMGRGDPPPPAQGSGTAGG
ncbi:MAG: hypothetical protein ACJ74O_08310 [Frankiaceae bacterium]